MYVNEAERRDVCEEGTADVDTIAVTSPDTLEAGTLTIKLVTSAVETIRLRILPSMPENKQDNWKRVDIGN